MLAAKMMMAVNAAQEKLYVDDVFSTYLYTGNGSTQTITNGIDLAGKGGLVMLRGRATGTAGFTFDTAQGVNKYVLTNSTNGQASNTSLTTFNSNGFSLSSAGAISVNDNGNTYASWTFRRAPKFFDIVTYTGNGVAGRQIPHGLGVAPGMIIVKRTDATGFWAVYHISLGNNKYVYLQDTTTAGDYGSDLWSVTDSSFIASTPLALNTNGASYVAYLFAHDPEV